MSADTQDFPAFVAAMRAFRPLTSLQNSAFSEHDTLNGFLIRTFFFLYYLKICLLL